VEAVDGEVAAVDGKDFAEAFALGDTEKSGVGELHAAIGVFAHEFADAGKVVGVEGQQRDCAAFEHLPNGVLCGGQAGEQVHGFDERGPDGGERFAQGFQGGDAFGVVLVGGVDEGDERASVDENQRRLPLRFRSLVKRRPVCSERWGLPPRTTPRRSDIAS